MTALPPEATLMELLAGVAEDYLEAVDGEWGCCHDVDEILKGECGTFPLTDGYVQVVIDARAVLGVTEKEGQ